MAKFHSPRPSSGEELSPSVRSVKHASNHPRMTRQSVASHRLSPDVTAAPTPDPHLGLTPARPSSSKKAAATRASTSAASTNADCPEPFKDDTTASASNHPRRSKYRRLQICRLHLGRIATPVTVPALQHPDPATKLPLFPFPWTNSGCSERSWHSAPPRRLTRRTSNVGGRGMSVCNPPTYRLITRWTLDLKLIPSWKEL
ncbi:hypothetical protein GWK47_044657 [Chionoecetes opilio]|uniref:Uncharacterized protein n=1 Tax=Chionoecetes opilio TaxID=41210 RepID=A0A8J4YDQ4_CHIOP|nr:hypothetical protein GWK47_044657 [Chionoecetes opilio]